MRSRLHTDYNDPDSVEQLPFSPFDSTLREALRKDFIAPVAKFLMGKHETSLLAMEGNSAWETALSISNLLNAVDILREHGEHPELIRQVEAKVVLASRWLLEKKCEHDKGEACWEHVTWDTSVILNALMEVLRRYRSKFSPDEEKEIVDTIVGATSWLYRQFEAWETRIKYPFGPADVAQIANTVLQIQQYFPELLSRVEERLKPMPMYDLPFRVTQYLLRRRSFKDIRIVEHDLLTTGGAGSVTARGCWWDDYFSTAETVEALARFHRAAIGQDRAEWKDLPDGECAKMLGVMIGEAMASLRGIGDFSIEIASAATSSRRGHSWVCALGALCFVDEHLWPYFEGKVELVSAQDSQAPYPHEPADSG